MVSSNPVEMSVKESIVLDFKIYECYTHTDEIRVNCDSFNEKHIRKEVKPKFTNIITARIEKIVEL